MNETVMLRQIILITDGCSNAGENPVSAAQAARRTGITVNVIGVVDDGLSPDAREEIQAIAAAGEGACDFVFTADLSRSLQVLTRRSVQMTLEKAINRQLSSLVGPGGMENLNPAQRGKVVAMLEQFCEDTHLRCLILLDTSGSMKTKIAVAEDSVRDLLHSLAARRGASEIGIMLYPGSGGEPARTVVDFTTNAAALEDSLKAIPVGGNTPTGPAIRAAIDLFAQGTRRMEAMVRECVV